LIAFIDPALLRRFPLRIGFSLPSRTVLDGYYDKLLSAFPADINEITRKYEISFAEAWDYAFTLVKSALLDKLESANNTENAHEIA
jgi:hypothetical protein